MFKAYFKLPDELGRLRPRQMFTLLNGLQDGEQEEKHPQTATRENVPPHLWAFYGLD